MLLVDTHIAVWLYQKTLEKLTFTEIKALENNEIYISPIVVLEIEYFFEIGRIKKNSKTIIKYLAEKVGLKIDNIDFLDIIEYSIKEKWTRDPFDRIIVSHARLKKSYLLTKDKIIQKHYLKVIK
jgi:PIN domain nuclease of toxin-antitoxin system